MRPPFDKRVQHLLKRTTCLNDKRVPINPGEIYCDVCREMIRQRTLDLQKSVNYNPYRNELEEKTSS